MKGRLRVRIRTLLRCLRKRCGRMLRKRSLGPLRCIRRLVPEGVVLVVVVVLGPRPGVPSMT